MTSVEVKAGLFRNGESPALIGGLCRSCGERHFPLSGTCPYCAEQDVTSVELSPEGRLWAWTSVTSAPPGYLGEVPYGFGVVELDGGIRVLTRLTEPDPGRLRHDQPMRLVIVPLHVDGEGREVLTYAFSPQGGG